MSQKVLEVWRQQPHQIGNRHRSDSPIAIRANTSLRHHHGGCGRCVISRPLAPSETCLRLSLPPNHSAHQTTTIRGTSRWLGVASDHRYRTPVERERAPPPATPTSLRSPFRTGHATLECEKSNPSRCPQRPYQVPVASSSGLLSDFFQSRAIKLRGLPPNAFVNCSTVVAVDD